MLPKKISAFLLASILLFMVFPVLSNAQFIQRGDVNFDGIVGVNDARLALRAAVGLDVLSGDAEKAADADFNGTIEVADARLILRVAVGLEDLELLKHFFVETAVIPATCSQDGSRTLTCTDCGEIKTELLPATGNHIFVETSIVAATCATNGSITLICSSCGETKTEVLPATGTHTFVRNICINCHATEESQNIYNEKNGYTKVSGQITYQYNKFIGTRGDNGATVIFIPDDDLVKTYDNGKAVLLIRGLHESGIFVTKTDGYGNFTTGIDVLPAGKYAVLVISANTTSALWFRNKDSWDDQMSSTFSKYFSEKDLDTFKIMVSSHSMAFNHVEYSPMYEYTITHDFGYTYL